MSTKKILLIESSLIEIRLLRMTLQAKGYVILCATNDEDGLQIALDQKPDLIIKALPSRNTDEIELVKRVRETAGIRGIPIIAIISCATEQDKGKIIQAGCDACIEKPVNTRELPKIVEGLLSRSLMCGEGQQWQKGRS